MRVPTNGLFLIGLVLLASVLLGMGGAPIRGAHAESRPQPDAQSASIPIERKAKRIAVIPISGGIDSVTVWSLERRLKAARDGGYDAVVLEIDTPGGEVGAMLDICLRIRSDAPTNTVAWIKPMAFSAGTFIALACREIVVAPGSTFGDAAPIAAIPGMGITPLPAAERAKQESPLLDELDAAAARRGDDPRLLAAFVAVERELWLLEHTTDGARRFADAGELQLLGLDPNVLPAKPTESSGVRPLLPSERPLTDADRGAWRMVERVDGANTLLVVQSDEAMRWGLSSALVKDEAELQQHFLADSLTRFPQHWSEDLVRLLVSWPVRILLIGIFLVALVIEGMHPGVGVAGAIAATALLLLVGAPGLLGLAQWWEILLVIAGIVLLGVEILVVPGFGFAGIAGIICVVLGLVASFMGTDPTSMTQRSALLTAVSTTMAGLFLGALFTWFASRWLRESPLFRRAVLSASLAGGQSAPILGEPMLPPVGRRAVAESDLRPSGRVRHGDDVFDAQSTGDYITRGTPVLVVAHAGPSLVVERVDDSAPPASAPDRGVSP